VTDFSIDPGAVAPALDTVFSQLNRDGFADKLWARHTDLWSSDYPVRQAIANRLGWLDAPEFAASQLPRAQAFVLATLLAIVTAVLILAVEAFDRRAIDATVGHD